MSSSHSALKHHRNYLKFFSLKQKFSIYSAESLKMGIFGLYLYYLTENHNDPLQLLIPGSKIARSNNLIRLTVED